MTPTKHTKKNGLTVWTDRVREQGKNRKITAATKGELEDLVAAVKLRERERKLGIRSHQAPITYGAMREKFLAIYNPGTPRSVRTTVERLRYSHRLDGLYVREMTPETIQTWLLGLRKQDGTPLNPTTVRGALGALSLVLDAAVGLDYLVRNPASSKLVRPPKQERRAIRPFESWQEVTQAADAAKGKSNGALIRFACATGLREQEWQALRWDDIDVPARLCHVRQTVSDGKIVLTAKTDGSLRSVSLTQYALEALRDVQDGRFAGGLIFRSPSCGMIDATNWRNRVFYPALSASGLSKRWPKEMRHTFATLLLAVPGVDVTWVSQQMGHTKIETTLRYYKKWMPQAASNNLALIDAALAGVPKSDPATQAATDA